MAALAIHPAPFFPPRPSPLAARAGFRFVVGGVHTSRTIMLEELAALFEATAARLPRDGYGRAIVEGNCLGKGTVTTRRKTRKLLSELYALDPGIPAFRVLRHLWPIDPPSRPLLALLLALARDPLLQAAANAVLPLANGEDLSRAHLREVLRAASDERLNDATLEKVARNVASSWTQSGHLRGRAFKIRSRVTPRPVATAYALFLANRAGFLGRETLGSGWLRVLDASASVAQECAFEAKRMGLIELRVAGGLFDLGFAPLDPEPRKEQGWHGRH